MFGHSWPIALVSLHIFGHSLLQPVSHLLPPPLPLHPFPGLLAGPWAFIGLYSEQDAHNVLPANRLPPYRAAAKEGSGEDA